LEKIKIQSRIIELMLRLMCSHKFHAEVSDECQVIS
jgi:hypothetical protein